jgi:DNA-binding NtrC family response regulator
MSAAALPLLAGTSAARDRLDALLVRVASTPRTTVLVRGERGAGLRAAARLVHARSSRAGGPCIELRAAQSLAPGFVEAVFGPAGRLRAAAGGTLVLTEVHALAPDAQAALYAELADPTVDARIVATTTADLDEAVARGRLREDLFYRINVLALEVPPLRARREDVLPLARALLARLAEETGTPCPGITADAALALRDHGWPGNLHELRGVLAAAAARAGGGALSRADLALPGAAGEPAPRPDPGGLAGAADPFGGERRLRAIEERLIRLVLAETGGNKSRAARRLGLNRQTLYNKLEALAAALDR